MRIVSWNVNGLPTTLKDASQRYTGAANYFTNILHADVVCFQEAKIQEDKLEKWIACVTGFESFWAFSEAKKGYSGVVTYVKKDLKPLDAAANKLPGDITVIEDLCREGRIIETDHGSFVLVNVYVPNAGEKTEEGRPRLEFKIRFLQALKQKCDELVSSGRHVVVVGDFNIAHKAVDIHKKWNVEEIYSAEERAWLGSFLTEYVDLFRHFHPDANNVFSVWETKTDARIHNEGVRIDYAVCDRGFLSQVKDTQILKMVPKNWSDHAAVVLTLQEQPALPPHPSPSIGSSNMKRFQDDRQQKKLTSFFSRGASKPMIVKSTGASVERNLKQVNANAGDLSPTTSSLAVEKLEPSTASQKEEISSTPEASVLIKDGPPDTSDDPSCKSSTGNGNLEEHRLTANANETDGIKAVQQNSGILELTNADSINAQAENDEGKCVILSSRMEASESTLGLQSELDVVAVTNPELSSPHKRKQPSSPQTETRGEP